VQLPASAPANRKGAQVAGLPTSLSIALWLVGSIWLVAIVSHVLGAAREIVWVTLAAGIIAAVVEWLACERSGR